MTCNVPVPGSLDVTIRLPGGVTIQPMPSQLIPSNIQIVKNLLSQASSAMAPLMPVFNIIDAVMAIKGFADAVPGLLTDPTAIFEAIANLAEKVAALANLIPQLSVPLLIVDLVDTLIIALQGMSDELTKFATQAANIANARTVASQTGNPALDAVADCADDILAASQASLSASLSPLNSLIGVLNIFVSLIGLDPIPTFDDLPDDPQTAIDALNAVIYTLTVIRNAVPIP